MRNSLVAALPGLTETEYDTLLESVEEVIYHEHLVSLYMYSVTLGESCGGTLCMYSTDTLSLDNYIHLFLEKCELPMASHQSLGDNMAK